MIDNIVQNVFRFLVLVLLQVLIFNNIKLTALEITPYIYLLFILVQRTDIPSWQLLLLGFFTGLTIDLFTNTIGLHASATVLMALLRKVSLNINASRIGYEVGVTPGVRLYGSWWFFKYAFGLVFVHHLLLYFIDEFGFVKIHLTLLKVFLSSIFTFVVILLAELIVPEKKRI